MARIYPDDITDFLCALFIDASGDFRMGLVDADGHIQVDTLTTALPADAATATKQDTMITALQKIDDLQDALNSVGADMVNTYSQGGVRLTGQATEANQNTIISRMQDQLFSYLGMIRERSVDTNAASGINRLYMTAVPAGEVWVVTIAYGLNTTSAIDQILIGTYDGASHYWLDDKPSPGANEGKAWSGHMYLEEGLQVAFEFGGCTAGDTIYASAHGYKMSLD